jgi:hypothetical protein
MRRLPVERLLRRRHVGHQDRRIARAPRRVHATDLASGNHARPCDDLADAGAAPGPEIVGLVGAGRAPRQRRDMGGGKVGHVHIVAHTGAILGLVVGAEHRNARSRALRRLQHQRDEVGLGIVLFTHLLLGIGPGRIEVTKRDGAQPVGGTGVTQDFLSHQLGPAIRIDGSLPHALYDRQPLGDAVGRATAGEDDRADAVRPHHLDQRNHAADVGPVVARRLDHRLPDIGQGGKIDNCFRPVLADRRAQRHGIVDVAADQGSPLHGPGMPGVQIVVDDRQVAGARERLARMRADIAGAPRHQNTHYAVPHSNALPAIALQAG